MTLKELKQAIELLSAHGDDLEIECSLTNQSGDWTDIKLVSVGQFQIVPNATFHFEFTHGEWFKG